MNLTGEIKKYTLSATINGRIVNFTLSDIAGDVNFNGFKGVNVGDPVNPGDIANKQFVVDQLNGAGLVTSVNGQTGAVTLDYYDTNGNLQLSGASEEFLTANTLGIIQRVQAPTLDGGLFQP